jgi:hypothetical protein
MNEQVAAVPPEDGMWRHAAHDEEVPRWSPISTWGAATLDADSRAIVDSRWYSHLHFPVSGLDTRAAARAAWMFDNGTTTGAL